MAIQQGINQLLSGFGTLAMLSPGLRARAETRAATQKAERKAAIQQESFDTAFAEGAQNTETIEKLEEKLETETNPIEKMKTKTALREAKEAEQINYDLTADITKQRAETARELFDLDPTEKTYENLKSAMKDERLYSAAAEGNRMINRQEAMRKMQDKGMSKVKQNKAFTDLVGSLRKEGY